MSRFPFLDTIRTGLYILAALTLIVGVISAFTATDSYGDTTFNFAVLLSGVISAVLTAAFAELISLFLAMEEHMAAMRDSLRRLEHLNLSANTSTSPVSTSSYRAKSESGYSSVPLTAPISRPTVAITEEIFTAEITEDIVEFHDEPNGSSVQIGGSTPVSGHKGDVVKLVGRTEDAQWLQLRKGGATYWVSVRAVKVQKEVQRIPVTWKPA